MSSTATVAALFQQAVARHRSGLMFEADALCGEVLSQDTRHAGAWHLRGLIAIADGKAKQGIEWIRESLRLQPEQPPAHSNIGNALLDGAQPQAALACFEQALKMKADYVPALYNRGNALRALGRHAAAIDSYDAALRLQPFHASALNNRGLAQLELARPAAARASFEQAVAADPRFQDARRNLAVVLNDAANALLEQGRAQDALTHYDASLQLLPQRAETLYNRGAALRDLRRYSEAAQHFAEALQLEPDNPRLAIGNLFHARMDCCDWRDYDALAARLHQELARERRIINPLSALLIDEPAVQLACANGYVAHKFGTVTAVAPTPPSRPTPDRARVRIAYVSGDFREHPVGYLLAGVLEQHDRTAFEVIAVSLRSVENSALGMRLHKACDRFIEARDHSDASVAALMRDLGIDIAVDLMGFTQGARLGIFANRAAPAQVAWLGYAGTTGATFMDYLIADAVVVPPGAEQWYSERVIRLPHSYLPNDDRRGIAPAPTRAEAGLPDCGFVFCAFTNSYKINPHMFDAWMQLLKGAPDSLLWLRAMGPEPESNLTREARRRGIDPARLVFAPLVSGMDQHLARLSLANLCLDTLPYNGHSTTCDALWAGVPVLTCPGRSFASRVASSALTAVGMPELIAGDLEGYVRQGLLLARTPGPLEALSVRLRQRLRHSPLFDTQGFTRHLESAYRGICGRGASGL